MSSCGGSRSFPTVGSPSAVSSHGPQLRMRLDSGILMPGITVGLSSISFGFPSQDIYKAVHRRLSERFFLFHLAPYSSLYCCNPNPLFPIIAIMRYSFAAAALAVATVTTGVNGAAMPQTSSSSSGCQISFEGSFQIKVVTGSTPATGSTLATPRMNRRAQVCHSPNGKKNRLANLLSVRIR